MLDLAATGRGWVDLHPLLVDEDGSARQAVLGGGFHLFPASYFVVGSLAGLTIPCVSMTAQRLFHSGYPPRDVDVHDLQLLDELNA